MLYMARKEASEGREPTPRGSTVSTHQHHRARDWEVGSHPSVAESVLMCKIDCHMRRRRWSEVTEVIAFDLVTSCVDHHGNGAAQRDFALNPCQCHHSCNPKLSRPEQ